MILRSLAATVAALVMLLQSGDPSDAASLRVAPVIVDLRSPTAASTIRVWNDARQPINVQIRVFRWRQRNGEDTYEATNDVVVSPPIATLQPGGENIVRVVRVSKRPVQGEESYRLVVDELPDPSRRAAGNVALVVRHSIPVFFATNEAAGANPSWSVRQQRGGFVVTVQNNGTKRLKVSNLALSSGAGTMARREGLVGYVLGNSTASWFVPGSGKLSGRSVTITADSEAGRFDATARLRGG